MAGDKSREVLVVSYLFLGLTWFAVSLRCFVRIKLVNRFGIDDFLMIAALPIYTVFCVCAIVSTYYGTGRHVETLTPTQIRTGRMYWKGGELTYVISSAVAKLSVGFFLLRITISDVHGRILKYAMLITALFGVFFFFILLVQCVPVSYFWTVATEPGKGYCMPLLLLMYGSFAYMIVGGLCDFVFGLLPIWIVWHLSTGRRAKIGLVLILSMGALAGCATVIRMPYIRNFGSKSDDFLWITTEIVLWSLIEVGLGITAGSLATTRPLFRRLMNSNNEGDIELAPVPLPDNGDRRQNGRPGWTTWQTELTTRGQHTRLDAGTDVADPRTQDSIRDAQSSAAVTMKSKASNKTGTKIKADEIMGSASQSASREVS